LSIRKVALSSRASTDPLTILPARLCAGIFARQRFERTSRIYAAGSAIGCLGAAEKYPVHSRPNRFLTRAARYAHLKEPRP
jgi:hypothetical protein